MTESNVFVSGVFTKDKLLDFGLLSDMEAEWKFWPSKIKVGFQGSWSNVLWPYVRLGSSEQRWGKAALVLLKQNCC